MSLGPEDRLRSMLSERAGDVAPATDWEDRVLTSGRRRKRVRRIGAAAVAAALVAVVAVGANVFLTPVAQREPEPVKSPTAKAIAVDKPMLPEQTSAPAPWQELSRGEQTTLPYYFANRLSVGNGVRTMPDRIVALAGDQRGLVLLTRKENDVGAMDTTVRYLDGGRFPNDRPGDEIARAKDIRSVAMSEDGRLAAWDDQSAVKGVIRVADLVTGKVVATIVLPQNANQASLGPAFVGSDLVFSVADTFYVWSGEGEPKPWALGGKAVVGYRAASTTAGLVLLSDSSGCSLAIGLRDGDQRWKQCAADIGLAFSPDGKVVLGAEEKTLVFRSAASGKVVARADLPADLFTGHFGWESPTSVIGVAEPGEGSGQMPAMVRCRTTARTCEAVPSLLVGGSDYPFETARHPGS